MDKSKVKSLTLEEIWWEKFYQVQVFYKKEGHLTIPCKQLSNWIHYQCHEAKGLSTEQLVALDSIHYKDVKPFRKCDAEEWEKRFEELVSRGSTKGSRKLQVWLSYQRKLATTNRLSNSRIAKLEAHGFDMRSPV